MQYGQKAYEIAKNTDALYKVCYDYYALNEINKAIDTCSEVIRQYKSQNKENYRMCVSAQDLLKDLQMNKQIQSAQSLENKTNIN